MKTQLQTMPIKTPDVTKELTPTKIEKLIAVFSPMPLIKYPYFVSLGRRNRKREISYEETAWDGEKIKWTVKSRDYLPGEMEFKVWCWILHKVSEARKPLPTDFYIPYTLTEIARYWNLSDGGKVFSLIANAINNLRNTDIHHWICKPQEKPQDLAYSLLADRVGKGENGDRETLNKNAFFLGPVLIKLLNTGPIKPAALEQIKFLADNNLVAARLYELLGWKFHLTRTNGSNTVSFLYSELATRIGLKLEKYQSDAKRQFAKAHTYLKKKKILHSTPRWEKTEKDWEISYSIGESLVLENSEWGRRKKIKSFATQIEYNSPEIDCALEEISNYTGDSENNPFRGLVKKIFQGRQNGFDLILRAISETKQEAAGGRIKNKAAYLTTILKKYSN